jgi:hypothetical protein
MRISINALSVSAALLVLAGCSGGGSSAVTPMGGAPNMNGTLALSRNPVSVIPKEMLQVPSTDRGLVIRHGKAAAEGVYVTEFSSSQAQEYKVPNPTNKPPFCTLSGLSAPNGVAVEARTRNFYEPDGGSRTIIIHKPACGAQVGVALSDPNGQPSDIAFNDTTGTRYVSDIFDNGGAAGTIQVYKKNDTTPSSQLSDPSFFELIGIETDHKNNVWETYIQATGAPGLIEFVGGKMPGQIHNVNGLTRPGGIEFAANGDMIIVDINTSTPLAQVYKPPYSGNPIKTIPLKGAAVWGKIDCQQKNLYIVSFTNSSLDVYKWPSGAYEYSVTNGIPSGSNAEGVAVDPADTE